MGTSIAEKAKKYLQKAGTNSVAALVAEAANADVVHSDEAVSDIEQSISAGLEDGTQAAKSAKEKMDAREAAIMRESICDLNIIQDHRGEVLADIKCGNRVDVLPVGSAEVQDALLLRMAEMGMKRLPGQQVIEREIAVLKARARQTGVITPSAVRTAKLADGRYAHDLNDADGHVVLIGPSKVEIVTGQPAKFRRPLGQGTLPMPIIPDTPAEALEIYRNYLSTRGITGHMSYVLPVVVADSLRPDTPYPITEYHGPAGSGKTTAANEHIQIIDPTAGGTMPNTPISEENFAAACQVRLAVGLDNASNATPEQQNVACQTSTGVTSVKRRFNTQGEVINLPIFAPLVIAAVTPIIKAPDARTRTISVPVPIRTSYAGDDEVRAEFLQVRPKLLGALYKLLSVGLERLPHVVANMRVNHRLVNFGQLGEAILQGCDFESGEFLKILESYRRTVAGENASGDPLVSKVIRELQSLSKGAIEAEEIPAMSRWESKGSCAVVKPNGAREIAIRPGRLLPVVHGAVSPGYPTNDRHLDEALIRATPTLRDVGIVLEKRGRQGRPYWHFAVAANARLLVD